MLGFQILKNRYKLYLNIGINMFRYIYKYLNIGIYMNKIDSLFKIGRISKLNADEKSRYINFFSSSYKENLEHCKFNLVSFPRWSIISGYYAMHDLTKLFLADRFNVKINYRVHETTIILLGALLQDKEVVKNLDFAYNEFLRLLNDLAEAKDKRTKVQYYTGTAFLKEKYARDAKRFMNDNVIPYLNKLISIKNAI